MPVVIGVGMITEVTAEYDRDLGHGFVDVTDIGDLYSAESTHVIVDDCVFA